MAVVEVSTWSDFVAAVTVAGNTVKLTRDIDCNDEIPFGVTSPVTLASDIDGQGYKIRNLRSSVTNPVDIFRTSGSSGGTRTISNVDFVNIIVTGNNNYFLKSNFNDSQLKVNNCRFVGRRQYYFISPFGGGYQSYATFTSCYFHIPYYGSTAEYRCLFNGGNYDYKLNMYFCRINEAFVDGNTPSASYFSCVRNAQLTGCRLEGINVLPASSSTLSGAGAYNYASNMQNVFDWDLRAITDVSANTYTFNTGRGIVRKSVRNFSDPSIIYTPTVNGGTNVIPCTDAEMIDPAALYAKGFDIIVP